MGLAKSEWIDAQERGWNHRRTHVCAHCVEDTYLKDVIRRDVVKLICDYCGRKGRKPIAAPIDVLLNTVYQAIGAYFHEPADAGVPTDGGHYIIDPLSIADVLANMGFEGHEKLVADVIKAEPGDGWVPAANGHWASSHDNEVMSSGWNSFTHAIKHETRFHFSRAPKSTTFNPNEVEVCDLLPILGSRLTPMLATLRAGTELFRARKREPHETWGPTSSQMGAPPPEKATAGRMNPAGIAYLYTSLQRQTALCEVGFDPHNVGAIFVASFELSRDLLVVDLTREFSIPSIFDVACKHERDHSLFMREFVEAISAPVQKDGREHIAYVPSQVVCEYLAQVYEPQSGKHLAGILFPSAVHQGGKNLVVFPSREGCGQGFHGVAFKHALRRRAAKPGTPAMLGKARGPYNETSSSALRAVD